MAFDGWFTSGEACRALGISRTTLLAAEEAGLLSPVRTPGGHRRFPLSALERYLGSVPATAPRSRSGTPEPSRNVTADMELAGTVRDAVRPLVRALDAECAGLYLTGDTGWRFAGAAGVPRWLAGRLAGAPAPEPVTAAARASSALLFEPADEGFPDGRSAGHGVATRVRTPDRPLGALFLVTGPGHPPLPAELRVVDAVADVLAILVDRLDRAGAVRERLHRIAALCDSDRPPPGP